MRVRQWSRVYLAVRNVARELPAGSRRFPDYVIVLTLLYAAYTNKPISWACDRSHWDLWMQRILKKVPSSTTMSRRLRRRSIEVFMARVLEELQGKVDASIFSAMDATVLELKRHTKDMDAGFGYWKRDGRCGVGYRLHVLIGQQQRILSWSVAPASVHEIDVAHRLIKRAPRLGYVLADSSYDSNALHRRVSEKGGLLVALRKRRGAGMGHRRHEPGRYRSIELTEGPSLFGRALVSSRSEVERFFSRLDTVPEALGELPSWVRTMRRVRRWIHAKLILAAARSAEHRLAA